MITKLFRLSETEIKILKDVQNDYNLSSEAEAARYIIQQYDKLQKQSKKISESVLRGIEEKLDLLLDVANTDLIKRSEEVLYPVRMVESPVITKARKLRKQDLSNRKQRSDYNKKKNS